MVDLAFAFNWVTDVVWHTINWIWCNLCARNIVSSKYTASHLGYHQS